ncbi:MAG: protein kinase family protein with domain [Acidimicrobiaceae bacterium]|nr:protein kinase family protein with domain [Acidimicrobiaceae bacterium]
MSTITEQLGRDLAGRYRLEAGLGTGASAHVYAAFDGRLRRRVAVKLLHPGLSGDAAFLRRFSAEAQAVAALNHPNVLQVFDWGEEEDGPFLVLEYLGGGSLRDLLDQGHRLTPAQAAAVGAGVARGLAYAHRRGLVHRDVKPANVLFDAEGGVRIADFGLARALAEAAWTEPQGAVLGTARYASPEQAEGRSLDGRSDVYSLALVLYEAVTGRVPFSADTTVATLMARIGATLPPAPELGPLAPILAQAAISEPVVRLDADELAEDLEVLGRALPAPGALPLAPRPLELSLDDTPNGSGEAPSRRKSPRRSSGRDGAPSRTPSPDAGLEDLTELGTSSARRGARSERARADRQYETDRHETDQHETDQHWDGQRWVHEHAADQPFVDEDGVEEQAADKRRPRRLRRTVLAVVLLLVLGAGAFVADRLVHSGIPVPAVAGRSVTAAEKALVAQHLRAQSTRAYSSAVPAGMVLSQRPKPGVRAKAGTPVKLVVSQGHAPVAVPQLVGESQSQATAALSSVHFAANVTPAYSETVPAGTVISASPASGTAPYGASVALQVSEGPHPRQIPQFSSSTTWAGASAALTGLRLSPIEERAYSDQVPAGEIIATAPSEGAGGVAVGSRVTVTVSLGPRLVTVPPVSNLSIAQALAALQAEGLNATEQIGPPLSTQATTTDPAPGTKVRPGTPITLYVK